MRKICVVGGGSWGTAIAQVLARKSEKVDIYVRSNEQASEINSKKSNTKYLPGISLSENIYAHNIFNDLKNYDLLVIAVPSKFLPDLILNLKNLGLSNDAVILVATKGLIANPARLCSEYITELLDCRLGFIAGPNFANEVAKDMFASVTIASIDQELATDLADLFASKNFRVSTTNDIVTVQIASAVKNVVAIMSGTYFSKNYGENALAWLISEGLREIKEIAAPLGGKIETITETGVAGDLFLTCYSKTSRNTEFGYKFVLTENKREFIKSYPKLVEGIDAAILLCELTEGFGVNIPIIEEVRRMLDLWN